MWMGFARAYPCSCELMTLIAVITSSYSHQGEVEMPRYLVERTFPDHLEMPTNAEGTNACRVIIANNSEDQVT
jgi:hypothetical protein